MRFEGIEDEIHAVIFDLWGTLAETYSFEKRQKTLGKLAYLRPKEWERIESLFMERDFDSISKYFDALADAVGHISEEEKEEIKEFISFQIEHSKLYPEVKSALKLLKGEEPQQLKLGLLSNTTKPYEGIVGYFGLEDLFNAVGFSFRIGFTKPHPKAYEFMLGRLEVEPQNTVMVGDHRVDDMLARKVGIHPILIIRDELEIKLYELPPNYPRPVIHSVGELVKMKRT